jgi:hypothetical protein
MHPGAQQIGGVGDPDDPRAGTPQLVDDRVRQRVVTADDDLTMKLAALASRLCCRFVARLFSGADNDGHYHSNLC